MKSFEQKAEMKTSKNELFEPKLNKIVRTFKKFTPFHFSFSYLYLFGFLFFIFYLFEMVHFSLPLFDVVKTHNVVALVWDHLLS